MCLVECGHIMAYMYKIDERRQRRAAGPVTGVANGDIMATQLTGGVFIMKYRLLVVSFCLALAFSFSVTAYASGTTEYALEELGVTVSLPSDYIVFTRDIDANDPNLAAYGFTKDSMSSLMSEKSIYLNGWDADISHEVVITMMDSLITDFNLFSDTTLMTMATTFESGYKQAGITIIKSEIYQHAQAKFLKIYISQPNGTSTKYGLQYYTVYEGKAINITLHSYSGPTTSAQEMVLKNIVDSAAFDTEPQIAEPDFTPSGAFTYTDPTTKATFTVPANWIETPLSEERKQIDVKFTSLEDGGMIIMYSGLDVWSKMTALERIRYNREDINNSYITKTDIADILGLSSSDITLVTYGENEFYIATVTSDTEAYGLSFTVTITHAALISNGYMYLFQFSGARDNALYNDFETLLTSLVLSSRGAEASTVHNAAIADTTDTDLTKEFNAGNVFPSLLVTIAIYSLPIIIYRYAIRKAPVDARKAKRITIIYGVCAFFLMSALIFALRGSGVAGGAILLWSWVNYRVLVGGKAEAASSEPADNATFEASAPNIDNTNTQIEIAAPPSYSERSFKPADHTCPVCGTPVPEESKFCHKCGAKTTLNDVDGKDERI